MEGILMNKEINATKLRKYYHKHGIKKTAKHFKVTPKTIYLYLKKYKIETIKQKKEIDWYDTIPDLNKRWAKMKYRNWWGCGD